MNLQDPPASVSRNCVFACLLCNKLTYWKARKHVIGLKIMNYACEYAISLFVCSTAI